MGGGRRSKLAAWWPPPARWLLRVFCFAEHSGGLPRSASASQGVQPRLLLLLPEVATNSLFPTLAGSWPDTRGATKTSTTVFLEKNGGAGDAINLADYRPVALQPATTKPLEKVTEQQAWPGSGEQVDDRQVELSNEQGGFRRPRRPRFDLTFLLRCLQEHRHSVATLGHS